MELDSTDDGSKIFQFLSSPMDFIAVKETMSGKELKGKNIYIANFNDIISFVLQYYSRSNQGECVLFQVLRHTKF